LRDVSGVLQGNGKCRVRKWVVGGERCECHGCRDGVIELSCIAKSANQAVMRLNMGWIRGNRSSKGLGRFHWQSGGEQVESPLGEHVGSKSFGHGWF